MDNKYYLIGVGASPYTRKLRAALRFRQVPYQFVINGSDEAKALPKPPRPLLPALSVVNSQTNDAETWSDSTPILDKLDQIIAPRPLRPSDPALAFIDALIEDYGDEWLSKCMFHYRWSNPADTVKASSYLPFGSNMTASTDEAKGFTEFFAQRQISRIGVVGSNTITAPVIEASWRRYLQLFDVHIQQYPYLLGSRPGAGDFACYGQMTMLVITDPTPMAVAMEESPRAYAWTERLEDLSGLQVSDEQWLDLAQLPPTLHALLAEIGRVYVPFLIANSAASKAGNKVVNCEIDGQPWQQDTFVYQARCFDKLRKRYAALAPAARALVDKTLVGTGCEALVAD